MNVNHTANRNDDYTANRSFCHWANIRENKNIIGIQLLKGY